MTRLLSAASVRRRVDPAQLPFRDTADLEPPDGIIGHIRAMDALHIGLSIRSPGYHVFAMGRPQTGIRSMVLTTVARAAARRPPAPDTVLLHNFEAPRNPIPVRLASGDGPRFAKALDEALERAAPDQPLAARGDAGAQRPEAEQRRTGDEDPAVAEHVAQAPPGGDEGCEHEDVGGNHPLGEQLRHPELVPDCRQRDPHQHFLEEDDRKRRAGCGDNPPLAVRVVDAEFPSGAPFGESPPAILPG